MTVPKFILFFLGSLGEIGGPVQSVSLSCSFRWKIAFGLALDESCMLLERPPKKTLTSTFACFRGEGFPRQTWTNHLENKDAVWKGLCLSLHSSQNANVATCTLIELSTTTGLLNSPKTKMINGIMLVVFPCSFVQVSLRRCHLEMTDWIVVPGAWVPNPPNADGCTPVAFWGLGFGKAKALLRKPRHQHLLVGDPLNSVG